MRSTTLLTAVLAAGAVTSPVAITPPSPTELAAEAPSETASTEAKAATPSPTGVNFTDDKIAGFRQVRGRPLPIHNPEHMRWSGPRQSPVIHDKAKAERAREEAHRLHDKLMVTTAGRLVAEDKMASEELAALDLEDADAIFTAVSTRLDRLTGSETKRIFTDALARAEETEEEEKEKNKKTKKKQPYAAITNLAPAVPVPVPVPEPESEAGDEAGPASSDGNVLETSADTPSGLPPMAPWVDNPSLLTNGEPVDIYRGPSIPQNVDLPPAGPWDGRVGPFRPTAGGQNRWYH